MDAHQPPDFSLPTSSPSSGGAVSAGQPTADSNAAPVIATVTPPNHMQAVDAGGGAIVEDDNDDSAIDQEWVDKAKDIVEQTKGDPFAQSRELNRAKADYLKTRYNKDFKVAEDKVQ